MCVNFRVSIEPNGAVLKAREKKEKENESENRGVTETWEARLCCSGAYRPISLLNTLGKLLEAVIARRLSYLAEKHGLLSDTLSGGRPGNQSINQSTLY